MIRQRVLAGLVAALIGVPLMRYWRGLDWPFALVVGLALGALAFLTVRAVQNLREWHPRR